MKSNKYWLAFLLALLTLASIIGYLFMSPGGTEAVITQDGIELWRIDLHEVGKTEHTLIEVEGTYHNTIEVEHSRIRVASADCPDQVCVKTGWIEDGTVPIVCLPNKLVIEITGGEHAADIAAK